MSVKRKLPTWAQLIALIKPKDINYYSRPLFQQFAGQAARILKARHTNSEPMPSDVTAVKVAMLEAIRIAPHWSHANAVKLRMLREQTILRPVLVARGPLHDSASKISYYGLKEGDINHYLLAWYNMLSYYTTGHPHSSAITNRGRILNWKNMAQVFDNKRYQRAEYTRSYLDSYYLNYLACLVNPHFVYAFNERLALSCGHNRSTPILRNGRYVVAMVFMHSKSFYSGIPRSGYNTMTRKNRDLAIKDIRRKPEYNFFRPSYNNLNLLHFGLSQGLYPACMNQLPRDVSPAVPIRTILSTIWQAFENCAQSPWAHSGTSSLACFVRK